MRTFLRWIRIQGSALFLAQIGLAQSAPAPVPAPGTGWAIPSAPARFVVELDHPEKPAALAWVSLDLPESSWTTASLRVFTEKGEAVGSDLLWTAPGEPALVRFDSSSGAKRYEIYCGSDWPALPLQNSANGVLLESRAGDGKSVDHLPDMLQAWNQGGTIQGRALVEGLFEGGNRFGPQGNSLEHFKGWFTAAEPEHLELSTISNDASFVLVDGKEVVEWPGLHDFHGGLAGQHQGAVDLAAGVHALDYYNAYVASDERHPLLCCLAVKGGTLSQWTMLTPTAPFFLPTASAHVVDYAVPTSASGGAAPPFALEWEIKTQSVIGAEIPDVGLISVQLACVPPPGGVVNWSFDDGSSAQGTSVLHLFPRPGMRQVKCTVVNGTTPSGPSIERTISVHPNWTELTTFPPQLIPADQAEIMARDPATLSASDLAGCVAVFEVFKNGDGLLKLLAAVDAKMKEIPDADLSYLKDAGVFLASTELSHFDVISPFLSALVERCAVANPSPPMAALGSSSRLVLAELTLETSDQTGQVRQLLAAIDIKTLSGEERRSFNLLEADLALATGDLALAKKQDEALTGEPSGIDARSSIRRTAEIGRARAFMDRKEFEAAEHSLNQVARQAPIEKLSPEWALAQLRLYQEENLDIPAYLWAKRLLPVIIGEGRSELLFRLTELALARGDNGLARTSLAELLQQHPYSPEAAQAKEKWPAMIPGK